MEPLHPALREQLKRAHPGLTDEDITRYEELTSLRFQLHPDQDAERLREIDAQRTDLIRTKMPRFAEISRAFVGQLAESQRKGKQKKPPEVKFKGPGDADKR